MQNNTDTSPGHDPAPDDAVEADVLIGRIIDLEATAEDQQRFEQLAIADPSLWRALATRQQDMAVSCLGDPSASGPDPAWRTDRRSALRGVHWRPLRSGGTRSDSLGLGAHR